MCEYAAPPPGRTRLSMVSYFTRCRSATLGFIPAAGLSVGVAGPVRNERKVGSVPDCELVVPASQQIGKKTKIYKKSSRRRVAVIGVKREALACSWQER